MRVVLVLDRRLTRAWHADLIASLEQRPGTVVAVRWSDGTDAEYLGDVERLFRVERCLHRLPPGPGRRIDSSALETWASDAHLDPDVVIDLSGKPPAAHENRLYLTFDGELGETGLLAALLGGNVPTVEIVDAASGTVVAAGSPGSDIPSVAAAAFDDILATTVLIIAAALDRRVTTSARPVESAVLTRRAVRRHLARSVARAAVHRLYRLLYRAPHWRVGWRVVDGPDVIDLLGHPESGWHELPDDGYHFYADPFPVVRGDSAHLFVEDFDHRVGRGVISVVPFTRAGPVGTPQPVLEHNVHLSYPFVLEDDGNWWMIPETSQAGTIELYRADPFPTGWRLEAVLVEGVQASDATVFRHHDRWWMTATVRTGGSHSDALHLWSAPSLVGPWRPHDRNPVLIDISAARPAGYVVSRGGRLIRPSQDGRSGYGAALTLAEITQLDDAGFAQRVLARVTPDAPWTGNRLHTLNRSGWLECIDGSALSPRFKGLPHRRHE